MRAVENERDVLGELRALRFVVDASLVSMSGDDALGGKPKFRLPSITGIRKHSLIDS